MDIQSDRASTHDLGGAIRAVLPSLDHCVRFAGTGPAAPAPHDRPRWASARQKPRSFLACDGSASHDGAEDIPCTP